MAKEIIPRQLTEKEKARVVKVEKKIAELQAEGYVRKDHIISIVFANVMAIVLSAPFILFFGAWFIIRNGLSFTMNFSTYLLFIALLIILIVVHELIHGLTWGLAASQHFQSIEFGFMKEFLTPYCSCTEPLSKGSYIIGAFMPCFILGILPAVAGVLYNSLFWLLLGILMIMGAGGDLTIILKMLTYHADATEIIILDHPCECGYITLEK